jgi:tetratricopeptide (TPR) repeat protein
MKRTYYWGFFLLLMVALAIPAIGQQQPQAKTKAEYDAYLAFFNEANPQTKAQLGEKFLTDFADSDFRQDSYTLLVRAYTQSQTWAKVMETAEKFTAAFPDADAPKKAFVYENAMAAAQQTNNFEKIVDYGEKVLGVDTNNLNASLTLASMLPERLPQDEAAKNAALDKAMTYATKAQGLVTQFFGQPKPAQFTDEQWNRERANLEGQIHATMGFIHLNRQKYQESTQEYDIALKSNPGDGVARFRLGLAYQYLASDATKLLLDAINTENEAKAARAEQLTLDELVAKREGLEADVRTKRDRAIDELATAVAIGGIVGQPAREQLERLYRAKNNDSIDGLDALINEKRTQIPR